MSLEGLTGSILTIPTAENVASHQNNLQMHAQRDATAIIQQLAYQMTHKAMSIDKLELSSARSKRDDERDAEKKDQRGDKHKEHKEHKEG
ncbi:hypothetical protein RsTz2092_01960 [Deferribacterales bacterium RsTz2092]|nr:hypothetical protein AGMMS49941_02250 [Deferribacterales bacterium]